MELPDRQTRSNQGEGEFHVPGYRGKIKGFP